MSFTTSDAHQYQVYIYIPDTPYKGNEPFVIEGKRVDRDINKLTTGRWLFAAPKRWVYLGTHPNDGTLNITWQHTNAAEKFFIRQLPTVEEAYTWISSTPSAPSDKVSVMPPLNLRIRVIQP